MCNVALVGLAISAIGTGVSIAENNATAKKQGALLEEQREQNRKEIQAAASEEAGSRVAAARAEMAKRLVAAGEAGVSGNSVNAELNNVLEQSSQDVGVIAQNAIYQGVSSTLRAQNEALSIRKTSGLSAGLQIAGSAMSGYSSGMSIQRNMKK